MQPDSGTRNPVTPVVEAGGMTGLGKFANINTTEYPKVAHPSPNRHADRTARRVSR
jgi:hypothetical protein